MANQMIALGARAPQGNPIGNVLSQSTQMANMARQQAIADRQAVTAEQNLKLAQSQEARAAAKEGRDVEAAKLQRISDAGKIYRDSMVWAKFGDEAALQKLRDLTVSLVPELDKVLPQARVLATDIDQYNKSFMTAQQLADATVGPRETEVVEDAQGNKFVSVTGGFGKQGIIPLNEFTASPSKTAVPAPAAGGAPAAPAMGGVNARATNGANTTPQDLMAQGVNPRSIPTGNPFSPISDTGAPAQPDLGAVVQNMMRTGVVSQADFEAMRAAAPGKDAQLAEIMRSNNIQIMPDEQQVGGMQSAVYRPGENDASMTQVQSLEGYQDTGRQFRGKSPMQGPLPGSAQVPLPRVRAEAQAGRKTPQEIYEEKRMEKRAEADADFMENLPKAKETARFMYDLVDQMIGDANIGKNGQISVKPGGRAPKAGFEDVVGATWRPGTRFISGTNAANFDALLKQVEGQQFLKAYETLKGTGQITEIEGQKATDAMSRMKRSVSETEFVKAAREFMGVVQAGLNRLDQREAKLGGSAPANARRTPVKKGSSGWGAVEVVGD